MKAEKSDRFYCADFTRDGALVAAGNYFETLVFARASGERVCSLRGAGRLAFSPDGRHLAITYNGAYRFDPRTGEPSPALERGDEYHAHVAWMADGSHLVGVDFEGRVRFWRAADGALAEERGAGGPNANSLAALGDGTMLLTREGRGHVERVGLAGEVDRIDFGAEEAWGLVTARDAPVAAALADDDLVVFDVDANEVVARLPGNYYTRGLTLSDDAAQVAVLTFAGTSVYAVASGERLVFHEGVGSSLFRTPRFLADDAVLVAHEAALVVLRHASTGAPPRPPTRMESAGAALRALGRTGFRASAPVEHVDAVTVRVRLRGEDARVDVELSQRGWLRVTVSEPDLLAPSWIRPGPVLRLARWVRGKLGRPEPADAHDTWAAGLVPGATAEVAPGALMWTAPLRGVPDVDRLRALVDEVVARWRSSGGSSAG